MSVPSSRAAAALQRFPGRRDGHHTDADGRDANGCAADGCDAGECETSERERLLAEALLELASSGGSGGTGAADGGHPKPAALAAHARRRLAEEGRRCETAVHLGAGPGDGPAPYGFSGERAARLRLTERELREGPATETLRTGVALSSLPLTEAAPGWPRYTPTALEAGVRAVHTVLLPGAPDADDAGALEVRDAECAPVAGVLVVHLLDAEPLGPAAVAALGALARACALGLAHESAVRRCGELERALGSRVVIEQAKGVLAERRHGSVDDAFRTLRAFARSHRRPLHQVARDVVEARLLDPPFQRRAGAPPYRRGR
ncbi:ANTAR domain-containing protein [Streptomyces sp. 891-h]|uniref:ANTAR domain-containing protein n=1 Tax=Streptomyces sp. 891-h TaxID=2720714 RepID=UPI001FAB027B|nr:ANTAR domain-containing protein [Streptomyces sp. 891-h]UNZ17377.1 ANTAR domain-containing protein [Streptomyces sp. 891-h]